MEEIEVWVRRVINKEEKKNLSNLLLEQANKYKRSIVFTDLGGLIIQPPVIDGKIFIWYKGRPPDSYREKIEKVDSSITVLPYNIYLSNNFAIADLFKILDQIIPIALGQNQEKKTAARKESEKQVVKSEKESPSPTLKEEKKEEKIDEEELEKLRQEFQKNRELIKQEFIKNCAQNFIQEIDRLEDEIKKTQTKVEKISQQLVEQSRQLQFKQERLRDLEANNQKILTKFAQEFENITKIPEVERIQVTSKKIVVYTRPITLEFYEEDGRITKYDLGRFKIIIWLEGDARQIEFNSMSGYWSPHPHINDNRPCWGTAEDAVNKYLSRGDYAVLVQLVIEFLKTYNRSEHPKWEGPY